MHKILLTGLNIIDITVVLDSNTRLEPKNAKYVFKWKKLMRRVSFRSCSQQAKDLYVFSNMIDKIFVKN